MFTRALTFTEAGSVGGGAEAQARRVGQAVLPGEARLFDDFLIKIFGLCSLHVFSVMASSRRFSESLPCFVNMNKRRKSIGLEKIFLGRVRAWKRLNLQNLCLELENGDSAFVLGPNYRWIGF